jgi:hypothetical protein
MIINLVIFFSLYFLQGIAFIFLSFIFWIFFLILVGLLLNIKTGSMIERNLKRGKFTAEQSVKNRKIVAGCIVLMLFMIGLLGLIYYSNVVPYIKAELNEGYLQDTVRTITKGKTTDYEKISSVLEWFDPENNNIYNSYTLTHSRDPYFIVDDTYIILALRPPFICVRCYEEVNPKWLLTSQCGACGEYSRLFTIMVDALGYDVRRVHAEGEDHIWDEVKIDDEWIPVDPTNVSRSNGGDGWEYYGFFEHKEGNASLIWAEYLHNDTISDLTSLYTNLTNITLHCVDANNNSLPNVTISIISHNLKRDPYHETFIENKPKPMTNDSGYCLFQIGGGNYTLLAESNNHKVFGELKSIIFSDDKPSYEFKIILNANENIK